MEKNKNCTLDVIESGILGFAVGDALGVPVEFSSRIEREKKPVNDMIGYGTHNMPEGTWSDDTSMTIATMNSINECFGIIDFEHIMQQYCDWFYKNEYTATGKVFDIGISTRKAIASYYEGDKLAIKCGGTEERSNGNGSLMRMLPIVFFLHDVDMDEAEEVEIINYFSSLTHAHEISKLGCKIYYDFLEQILNGSDPENAYNNLKNVDYTPYYSKEAIDKYKRVLDGNLKNLNMDEIKSSGYVISTLEASLWCILNSNSYEEAVSKAINLGGDTDTIGAITGSIAGIIYGISDIPERWLSKLKRSDYLVSLCKKYIMTMNNDISPRFLDDDFIPIKK